MPVPPVEWETLTFLVALTAAFATIFLFGIGCSVVRFVRERRAELRDLRERHAGSDTVA